MLNVDAVGRNVRNINVLEENIRNKAGGVGITLDARTVLGVQYDRVGEGYIGHVVVGLSAYGADG